MHFDGQCGQNWVCPPMVNGNELHCRGFESTEHVLTCLWVYSSGTRMKMERRYLGKRTIEWETVLCFVCCCIANFHVSTHRTSLVENLKQKLPSNIRF